MNKNIKDIEIFENKNDNIYSLLLKKDTFVFSDLFKDFNCSSVNDFIFTDVLLKITRDTSSFGTKNIISFSGKLKMDANLIIFKDFVNGDNELLISGDIVTTSKSLKEKIEPVSFSLKTVTSFHKGLFESVTLSKIIFQINFLKNNEKWDMTSKFTGELDVLGLTNSQSDNILFDITKIDDELKLNANMKNIKGAFGIETLSLKNVSITAILNKENVLNVKAQLLAGHSYFDFVGEVTPKATGIIANIQSFSLSDLDNIFEEVFHSKLILPLFDISFSNTSISFATSNCTINGKELKEGVSLSSELNAHGHNIETIAFITSKGVIFNGDLEEFKVESIEIKKSSLNFELFKKSLNKPSKFEISTCCEIEGLEVDSSISFEKYNNTWVTILYGKVNTESFTLGAILPVVQGTFVNTIGFSSISFFYASAECITLKNNVNYSLKKGIQLKGTLKEIPALTNLIGKIDTGLEFNAHFGTIPDIDISIPEIRLHLGDGINCDPLKIKIPIKAPPSFMLMFGMDIDIPNQIKPLHFDMIIELGAIEARGSVTMKNYWNNPFGINGLKIGPALSVQIGIIYEQFVATGIPSEFGVVGGFEIGDTVVDMAVKITENPMKEILSGKLKELNPKQLIDFTADIIDIKIPEIPNFFIINDLELYCAPSGGTIGTLTYEKGFSFSGDFVILNEKIAMYARVSETGIEASGSIENLEFGPLKISGKDGKKAIVDLELSETKQSIFIDGSLSLLGLESSTHVEISNKEICFHFEQNFFNLLKYKLNGQSNGSMKDLSSLDFKLSGEMDNHIIAFLEEHVKEQIDNAINTTNTTIDKAEKELEEAQKVYEAEFKLVEEKLEEAKDEADALKTTLSNQVSNAKKEYTNSVDVAKDTLANAKKSYDNVISDAQDLVDSTRKTYEEGINIANSGVDAAQRTYNNAVQSSQDKLDEAQRSFNNTIGYAQDKVNSAQRHVNDLESEIRSINRDIDRLGGLWDQFKIGVLKTERLVLEGSKKTAETFLWTAEQALDAAKDSSSGLLNIARDALNETKRLNSVLVEIAKDGLNEAMYGVNYVAFNTAKEALNKLREGSEYLLWKNAEKALDEAKFLGDKAISVATSALNDIANSAEYLALEMAKQALEAVKKGTSAITFTVAKTSLIAVKAGASTILAISKEIAKHTGDLITIKSITFSGSLKEIEKGNLLNAEINLVLLGKDFDFTLNLDIQDTSEFISSTFNKSFDEIKKITYNTI